jgi:tetratricopeptide (TPR) repeat protein
MWVAAMGALGWGDDFDSYDAFQEVLLEDARQRGSIIGFANSSHGYLFTHHHRGLLLEAIADAEQCFAAQRDGWVHFLPAARAGVAWSLIDRGEVEAAAACLSAAHDDATWDQSSQQALVFEAEARVHLTRGQPQQALDNALEAGRVFAEAKIVNPSIVPWRSCAAIAAARLGQTDRAEELVNEEVALARRFGAPRPIGVGLIATGLIRGDDGLEALEEAMEVLRDSPARLEHARALVLYGAALRRRGKVKAAREVLRSGLDLSARCAATTS